MADTRPTAGEIIWRSADNLLRFAEQFDAFWDKLCRMASDFRDDQQPVLRLTDLEVEDLDSGNAWLCVGQAAYFQVVELAGASGRPPGRGCVTLLAQIWSESERSEVVGTSIWKHARTPKLFVGYSRDKDDWWDQDLLDAGGIPTIDEMQPIGTHLWSTSAGKGDWVFCVPLDCINSDEDIQREILTPLWRLMRRADQAQAFALASATCRVAMVSAG